MNNYDDWRNDPRPTQQLIEMALAEEDEDVYWDLVPRLHFRATREVFDAARELCASDEPSKRELGADILSQLGVPERTFPYESTDLLLELLKTEKEPPVLASIASALGHIHDPRSIKPLARLKSHPDDEVRFSVVSGLLRHEDPSAVATLIEMSSDPSDQVRDWATFGLGRQIELDTPEIREALWQRIADPDAETRAEAIGGLAARKDMRVLEPLIEAIQAESVGNLTLEAATELGDPRLCPALLQLKAEIGEDSDLEEALASCHCDNSQPAQAGFAST